MKQPLVHIGYHKTATTWLQHNLLDNRELGFKRYISKNEIRDKIILPYGLDFDAASVKTWYQSIVDEDASGFEEKISVVSSERISGNPHSGGYDSKQNADRIAAVFPNARILIVIREPIAAIASCYLQYVKSGGVCSLKDYIEPTRDGLAVMPLFNFEHFNYNKLINYYQSLFNDVLVLHYEDFVKAPREFCSKITSFAGAEELQDLPYASLSNQGLSFLSCFVLRQFNKIGTKTRLNPGALKFNKLQVELTKILIRLESVCPSSWHKAFRESMQGYIASKVDYSASITEFARIKS